MKDLTVFVLTHNRGQLLLETINSIVAQDCSDFKFIVSDNSSNDETKQLLTENKLINKFEYRKRDKEYSSLDHFNMCLSEVETKYFILFHDDDVMLPNMISTLYEKITSGDYSAVACSAYTINASSEIIGIFGPQNLSDILIDNASSLIYQYLIGDIFPYPSYMYSKEKCKSLIFVEDAGKYSDVTWLARVAEQAPILWVSQNLMKYRMHGGQDSSAWSYIQQLKLINRMNSYVITKQQKKIYKKYRYKNIRYYAELHNHKLPLLFHYKYCENFIKINLHLIKVRIYKMEKLRQIYRKIKKILKGRK